MEILDKKSNRMSRVIVGVSERSEFPKLQRILDFLSLRNLLSNELFLIISKVRWYMFTGLVEEKGSVISLNSGDKSIKLKIKANKVLENVKLGEVLQPMVYA